MKSIVILFLLIIAFQTRASVCDGSNCKVILFDDFTGPRPDEDPSCYTKVPNCSTRPDWVNTQSCVDLDFKSISQVALLNKCRWKIWEGYSTYGREKAYRFDTRQVEVANGLLTITAKPSNDGVSLDDPSCKQIDGAIPKCAFVSGGLDSRPSFGGEHEGFDFRYGKVEIRARMDMGPGAFPALWLFPSRTRPQMMRAEKDKQRQYQEIDILEVFPNEPFIWRDPLRLWKQNLSYVRSNAFQTLHWGVNGTDKAFINGSKEVYHGDFHTYSVEWEPEKLVFKIDGKVNHTITTKASKKRRPVRIPNHEMFLILDMQLDRGKELKKLFKKNLLVNDVSQLKGPVRMQIDWVKVTAKKTDTPSLVKFPHPPLVPGVNYKVAKYSGKPTLMYPVPCLWGGNQINNDCHLKSFEAFNLPEKIPYLVKTELTDGGAGIYYVSESIEGKSCPYGGTYIKTVGGEFYAFKRISLYKNLCRLISMMPSGPVLVPGVNYSILSPESGQGFGVYYSQANGSFKCPFGGKAMDIHDNYGSFWWKPICKVMDFDSSKIDPLRSVEILMHSNPEKRTIRYRNDY